jgi:filamentous hemagglutinin family protein
MQLFAIEAPSRRSVLLSPIFLLVSVSAAANPSAPAVIAGPSALPSGGVVAHGQANFNVQGNHLKVTSSPGTIINWQSFSIGSGAAANFIQQSASSAVLNRVVGQNISSIAGLLTSNGRVFLTNPNGILISSGVQINAASFTAMTSAISDADFLAGNTQWSGEGSFLNTNGLVTVDGGFLAVGPSTLRNFGTITVSGTGDLSLLTAGISEMRGDLVMNGGILTLDPKSITIAVPASSGSGGNFNVSADGPLQTGPVTHWQGFSIESASAGTFLQSSGGVALNRVAGQSVSLVSGNLTANGAVTLTGAQAQVFTGGTLTLTSGTSVPNTGNLSITSPNGRTGAFRTRLRAVSGAIGGATQLTTNGAQVLTTGGTLALMTAGAASGATITLQKREPQF